MRTDFGQKVEKSKSKSKSTGVMMTAFDGLLARLDTWQYYKVIITAISNKKQYARLQRGYFQGFAHGLSLIFLKICHAIVDEELSPMTLMRSVSKSLDVLMSDLGLRWGLGYTHEQSG